MKNQVCPFCGSSKSTPSPSGEHLICANCQHIIVAKPESKSSARRPGGNARSRSKSMAATQTGS